MERKEESNENLEESNEPERCLQAFDEDLSFSFENERKYFDELYFRNSKFFKMQVLGFYSSDY
jgi:hypothetical protein